jgi:hypothetical protein
LGQAQRAIEDKNKQVEKHMSTIKELEANVQGLKQELTDYKLRAKKVLQQRETTIQELTEKLTSPGTVPCQHHRHLSNYSSEAATLATSASLTLLCWMDVKTSRRGERGGGRAAGEMEGADAPEAGLREPQERVRRDPGRAQQDQTEPRPDPGASR